MINLYSFIKKKRNWQHKSDMCSPSDESSLRPDDFALHKSDKEHGAAAETVVLQEQERAETGV
jgi:hypothetical protein